MVPAVNRFSLSTCSIASLLLTLATSLGAAQSSDSTYLDWNLPRWSYSPLRNAGLGRQFQAFYGLNPYYQRGDFDGDGVIDVAIQIIDVTSHKRGIAIIHAGDSSVHIVGAGHRFGNGGDDFSWLGVWRVDSPAKRGPGPVRETLYVEKPESASGWIVWNGHEYTWIQGSD